MLSYRLERIVSSVPTCRCAADIGTDHGYVPIALAKRGDIERIIGMDVRKGPLEKAEKNIQAEGLSDRIELRLSDGAQRLEIGEADSIVISGMGGELMSSILSAKLDVFKKADMLILSPQSELYYFRKYLNDNGFSIMGEEILLDEGKYYFILRVKYTGITEAIESHLLWYSPSLLASRDTLLKEYILRDKSIQEKILDSLKDNHTQSAENRKIQCLKQLELIAKALDCY